MLEGANRPAPRTYTVRELLVDLKWVVTRLPSLWSIWVGGRLPRALREKVVVAVAQVNACRMCEHAHTRMAREAGVSDAELAALENMDEHAFDRRTWFAIAHARERAQSGFRLRHHRRIADRSGRSAGSSNLSRRGRRCPCDDGGQSDRQHAQRPPRSSPRQSRPRKSALRRAPHQLLVLARRLVGHARGGRAPAKVSSCSVAPGSRFRGP